MNAANARLTLKGVRRVVVKVGSRSVAESGDGRFDEIASELATQRAEGRTVVLVSSGAILLGCRRLKVDRRPDTIDRLQACAAVGQSKLIQAYETAFSKYDMPAAQVLLTHSDLAERDRYLNARAAIEALFEFGAIPVINENDTVAVEEIKFGDNDQLAAMVAGLVQADLLILLTDVDGLLDAGNMRVPIVHDFAEAERLIRPDIGEGARGGMRSKVDAAQRATGGGIPVVVARASEPKIITRCLQGDDVGTLFLPPSAAK